ncbi:uncharacterized protein LOC117297905 [Asterias rubens]|uniref:uncharacterized protein LOC117297905 n=1 Tax=Asterias rubens TaxID=7604 RepID=UPI001455D41B|nr:uncharacterized protein LOC117297905 [Asterias rubens]
MSPGVSDSFAFAERDTKPSEPSCKAVHICSDIEQKHIKIIIRRFHINDQRVFSWDHQSGTKRDADSLCEGEDKFTTTPKKRKPQDEVKSDGDSWVPELGLQAKDRTILVDGEWLTDNHIVAGQRLLSRQFPALEGLQEPVLGNVLQFKPIVSDGVQVMQNGNNHWVTLFKTGEKIIKVMDSKNMGLTRQLTHQVINLCEGDDNTGAWEVRLPRMHRQRGSSDCGVFALAYATELAFKGDPEIVVYEQKRLRQHLKDCLEAMEMSPFPKKACKERTPREIGKRTQIVKKMIPTFPSPIASTAGFERSP